MKLIFNRFFLAVSFLALNSLSVVASETNDSNWFADYRYQNLAHYLKQTRLWGSPFSLSVRSQNLDDNATIPALNLFKESILSRSPEERKSVKSQDLHKRGNSSSDEAKNFYKALTTSPYVARFQCPPDTEFFIIHDNVRLHCLMNRQGELMYDLTIQQKIEVDGLHVA